MIFNWEAFGTEKIAVHCKTEAETIDFCKRAEEKGFNWADGSKRSSKTYWDDYKNRTCYSKHRFGNFECYEAQDYKILEWSDYMGFTKADLKDGMVCITREGNKYVLLNGWVMDKNGKEYLMHVTEIPDDLTCEHDECYDIVRVCASSACILDNYCKDEYLTEIWRREEPTEMTLSEICAALGKTVKIVKEH